MVEVGNAAQEAALTGESVPIDKTVDKIAMKEIRPRLSRSCNMCFSATLIAQGTGTGIVVTTGDFTEIGPLTLSS
jgi:magnesium-transporting ATPase (P-type)